MSKPISRFVAICLFLFAASSSAEIQAGHTHHLAIFGGATTSGSLTSATVGADYEYRPFLAAGLLGIGVLYDQALGSHPHSIVGVPVFLHPLMGLKFVAAPAMEFAEGASHFLFRAGIGYDIGIGPVFTLTPNFNMDFVSGHTAYVYGLSFGIGF